MKKTLLLILLFIAIALGAFFSIRNSAKFDIPLDEEIVVETETQPDIDTTTIEYQVADTPEKATIKLDVPFSTQAPFGEWSDERQQNGCEEVAAIMAMYWINDAKLISFAARKEIMNISDWEEANYGYYQDTSAKDTVSRIFNTYYKYFSAEVVNSIKIQDIIDQLEKGNLVIVPANGQKLNNPYFTAPGPEYHMIVVTGYDYGSHEFIVNDSGTKHGKDYRYKETVLFNAIRDYSSGNHEPIVGEEKNMIIVSK